MDFSTSWRIHQLNHFQHIPPITPFKIEPRFARSISTIAKKPIHRKIQEIITQSSESYVILSPLAQLWMQT